MTTRTGTDPGDKRIESREHLLAVFAKGEKPRVDWRIGTEHEKFVFRCRDHGAPSYEEPGGIRDLLQALTEYGWAPVIEGGKVVAYRTKVKVSFKFPLEADKAYYHEFTHLHAFAK